MKRKINAQAFISLTLVANIAVLSASSSAIGIALSNGSIRINNARAEGNASLFEGTLIETGASGSRLRLRNGSNIQLSSESRGKIYGDRLVLEKGNTKVQTFKPFEVDTSLLKISGSDNSSAQVSLHGSTVQVVSLAGTLKVVNSAGAFVTEVASGMSFDFSPADQAGASAPPDSAPLPARKGKAGKPSTGSMGGGLSPAYMVAGVLVAGAAVGTGVYYGTQGSTTPQACMSPCSSH